MAQTDAAPKSPPTFRRRARTKASTLPTKTPPDVEAAAADATAPTEPAPADGATAPETPVGQALPLATPASKTTKGPATKSPDTTPAEPKPKVKKTRKRRAAKTETAAAPAAPLCLEDYAAVGRIAEEAAQNGVTLAVVLDAARNTVRVLECIGVVTDEDVSR